MKTEVQTELPEELVAMARAYVEEGWVANLDDLIAESLRRFLESHATKLAEGFVMEDVAWGLRGDR